MNTTILEGYKALPYGEQFIAWLEENNILEAFINEVESRCNRGGYALNHYYARCDGKAPKEYVTLSLYFCRCSEGENYWADVHMKWVAECSERGYEKKNFTFDMYEIVKKQLTFSAYTLEEAVQKLEQWCKDSDKKPIAHEFISETPIE